MRPCRWPEGCLQRNLRRYGERVEQLGAVERLVADERNVTDVIEAFIGLHDARWQVHGQSGVLDGAPVQRFHRISAPRLQRAGLLRLHAWRLDGRIVAVQHVLVYGGAPPRTWPGTIRPWRHSA